MTDPTEAFLDKLATIGRVPMLARVTGTMRVEITNGKRARRAQVTVRRGQVAVGPAEGDYDCMISAHHQVWDALVTGEAQPLTTLLRGAASAAGDPAMLVLMRRLFAVAGVPELASGRSKLVTPPLTGRPRDGAPPGRPTGARAATRTPAKKTSRKTTKARGGTA